MLDTVLNFSIVFLAGTLVGVLLMIARDAYDDRQEELDTASE